MGDKHKFRSGLPLSTGVEDTTYGKDRSKVLYRKDMIIWDVYNESF
jgi:hypothetical protein